MVTWIDKNEFPFKQNFIEIDGNKIHYVDEGTGPVILMMHGTPEWSFGFRNIIKGLSPQYRCIAPDLLGFGLSDKPVYGDYTCKAHAARLEKFIVTLGLKNIRLLANDFGGAIAMSYALNEPDNVEKISLFNTWMWSLNNDKHFSTPAKIMGTFVGRMLYLRFGFAVNVMIPQAFADKSKLTPQIHQHYKNALSTPDERIATYAFAKELMDAGLWWDGLWNRLETIRYKPFLFFWGMQDKFIPARFLPRWQDALPSTQVIKLENAGHFVQEEAPGRMVAELKKFF